MEFLLDKEYNLKYKKSQSEILLDKNVSVYGFTYDKDYSTHLVYLQKNGVLKYVLFKDDKQNESVIGNFDTRSNSYNQLEILIINNRINIFYSYSNIINANIYTIHHVVINNKEQERFNIIRYVSKNKNHSFSVSSDSNGNIHLLYNTVSESFSYIYYTYFNPYKKQWYNNPTKISSTENHTEYPLIYVDTRNNIHSIYWELKDNGYSMSIKRMAQGGKDIYKWSSIQIPMIVENTPKSYIYEKNNLIIVDTENKRLVSDNYGATYTEEIKTIERFEESDQYELPNDEIIVEMLEDKELNVEIIKAETENDLEPLILELKSYCHELKELNNENRMILEQLLSNGDDLKFRLNSITEELASINSRINGLEEALKNSKSWFNKLFG